ncbi:MAG TPA: TolC family protein [bacterium]|mgnify:CR=1 FL=1|nr:TolC family protein [bacterium]HPN43823.1 TolC family protein [bacterium]
MKKTTITLLLILLFSVTLSFAQKTLTLAESKELALQNNTAMQNSRLEIKAARQVKRAALTKYFPTISAAGAQFEAQDYMMKITTEGGNLPVYDGNPIHLLHPTQFAYLPGSTMAMMKTGAIGMVTAIQPVFAGGRIFNGNRLASLGVKVSEYKSRMEYNDVLLTTEQQYWQVVSLNEKMKTIEKYESLLNSLLNQVDDAWKSGIVMKNDVLKVKLKQSEVLLNKSKLENGRKLAMMAFCQHIGIPYDSTLALSDSLFIDSIPQTCYIDAHAAVSNRVEYRLLQAGVRAETLQKRMKLGEYLPQVGVGFSRIYMKFDESESQTNDMVFGTASIPLSSWWEAAHTVKEHSIKEQIAKNNLQDNTELLLLQIQKAWQDLTDAYKQVLLSEEAKIQANENLQVNQDSYDNGLCNVSDLLEAQAMQQQIMDQLTDARANYIVKRTTYLQVTGR